MESPDGEISLYFLMGTLHMCTYVHFVIYHLYYSNWSPPFTPLFFACQPTRIPCCILLLQFSSLLVEHAALHIHDSNNKRQGAKLRRLMTLAWPCLLPKQCVDPDTKYHGHLLLAHIIAKFAISRGSFSKSFTGTQYYHSLHTPEEV